MPLFLRTNSKNRPGRRRGSATEHGLALERLPAECLHRRLLSGYEEHAVGPRQRGKHFHLPQRWVVRQINGAVGTLHHDIRASCHKRGRGPVGSPGGPQADADPLLLEQLFLKRNIDGQILDLARDLGIAHLDRGSGCWRLGSGTRSTQGQREEYSQHGGIRGFQSLAKASLWSHLPPVPGFQLDLDTNLGRQVAFRQRASVIPGYTPAAFNFLLNYPRGNCRWSGPPGTVIPHSRVLPDRATGVTRRTRIHKRTRSRLRARPSADPKVERAIRRRSIRRDRRHHLFPSAF